MPHTSIRILDIAFSLLGLTIAAPVMLVITILAFFDTGSPFFIQKRLGIKQRIFFLIKFRTMHIGTAQVSTHLAKSNDVTPLGKLLRASKLDELPQLINVLNGDMSLVGPRPGLPSQKQLTQEREKRGVYEARPGVSGLSQIKKIDMSTPRKLSKYDQLMVKNMTLCLYFKVIVATFLGQGSGDRIKKS